MLTPLTGGAASLPPTTESSRQVSAAGASQAAPSQTHSESNDRFSRALDSAVEKVASRFPTKPSPAPKQQAPVSEVVREWFAAVLAEMPDRVHYAPEAWIEDQLPRLIEKLSAPI